MVVHVGSNDVTFYNEEFSTPEEVAEKILRVGEMCKSYGVNNIAISSVLIKKNLKLGKFVRNVNLALEKLCHSKGFQFINNDNIFSTLVSDDGVHLTKPGINILMENLISFVNNNLWCLEGLIVNDNTQDESLALDDPIYNDSQVFDVLSNLRLRNVNRIIIGNLNVNSIANKIDGLRIKVENKIDILVITETKLDDSFPTSQFLIDGFHTPYRFDRKRGAGGIMIYVSKDIISKQLYKHSFTYDIEGIFIEINLKKCKWLLFGTYHPPSQPDFYYFENVSCALDIDTKFYDKILFICDFISEDSEPCFSDFLNRHECKNIVKDNTCFKSTENPSCIDLFLTKPE